MGISSISRMKYWLTVIGGTTLFMFAVLYTASLHGQQDNDAIPLETTVREVTVEEPHFEDEQQRLTQERRKRRIETVCERNGIHPDRRSLDPEKFRNIFVNEKHKFLYCEVPKVACTNWKRILLVLSGKLNISNPMTLSSSDVHGRLGKAYLKRLTKYSPEEIQHRLNHYAKFMFVRDPLERLLSAYRNKFTMPYNSYFRRRFGRRIIRQYRDKPSRDALQRGHDVTFREFVQYLMDPATTREQPLNAHWRQFYQLCHPCLVRYDYIGKYENIAEEAAYIIKKLNVEHLVSFPSYTTRGPKTSDLVALEYANISPEDLHELWQLYSVDFAMFGYQYPEFSNNSDQ